MNSTAPFVQRYRRTTGSRMGPWQSIDTTWKTGASAGLVGHDMYHHLPGDQGTFFQEVIALGAEWYVDVQPIVGKLQPPESKRNVFARNAVDIVSNALDSLEEMAFDLPVLEVDSPLSTEEMTHFRALATDALETLQSSKDPRALQCPDFVDRYVAGVVWGYIQAKTRFPDQFAARIGVETLQYGLAELEETDVPVGEVVTLTLTGHDCEIAYEDADERYLRGLELQEAVLMVWCSLAPSFPSQEITLHASERDYRDFLEEHFSREEEAATPEELQRIPQSDFVQRVYLRNPELQVAVKNDVGIKLPLTAYHKADCTPRQVLIF